MQKTGDEVLYSASDIVNYLECEHLTTLDLADLVLPLPRTADSDEAKLIQDKGYAHEADFLALLRTHHQSVVDVAEDGGTLQARIERTLAAMRAGVEVVFQAALRDGNFVGHADFLRKVDTPSALGPWSYEVLDTKLARSAKAKFVVQLGFYSELLAKAQGVQPRYMRVILGDKSEATFRVADYSRYLGVVVERFTQRVRNQAISTYPVPCAKCDQCKWSGLCKARWLENDHLSQVANITRLQVGKLERAGIDTLEALADMPEGTAVPKMAQETFDRLKSQARLQLLARQTGQNHLELLEVPPGSRRGFERLPKPDPGDLFFDMEGDPLEEGGLEYLFGVLHALNGKLDFKPFWAHDRAEEKLAFEAFMDFVTAWLAEHPDAHVYHYAPYEETALKKLMCLHGTREAEVDNLLRRQKLVDLYKVVRESIRVSEPRYSIKNIEHFYLQGRSGDVKSAGASIVYFERWKETGDAQLLKDIEDYNFDDVRSTHELRQWLLSVRPEGGAWFEAAAAEIAVAAGALTREEERLIPYRQRLVDTLPADRGTWGQREHLRELTCQLLDFHRRAAKPAWWAMFSRKEMSVADLLEDGESLAGLVLDPDHPPAPVKRSVCYTYLFPEQESKLKTGDGATVTLTGESVRELTVDEENRRVTFLRSANKDPLPAEIGLGPGAPIATATLVEAVFRFADSLLAGDGAYPAIEAVLNQALPVIRGHVPGSPIVPEHLDDLSPIIEAIANLDGSYVFVQGPPGAGKTYTGSHVIVALMQQGFTVGVSSNSHKAIHNLLRSVEEVAREKGFVFRGAKKSTRDNADSQFNGDFIQDVFNSEDVYALLGRGLGYQLAAGTAWLFADAGMDQRLDFLFVDEAGQVALANLVAMGTSARNIVLLGDQMQLGQPIQGVHPGRSGESSLEYLLNGMATIPSERGIFLGTTWRMHPDVNRFISDAVYDGRLEAEPHCAQQTLLLDASAHPYLRPTGVRYVPIEHDACSQRSQEEADLVRSLVENLMTQRYRDKRGREHPITLEDILVVAPYNMQVNLLKKVLPEGARAGTVDKFQGQEAQVVIVSMATSSGEYLPRFIQFLYSKNRLNVAISRAKSLAIFIANPALMSIACSTPEEMALVNTLCWVREYSESLKN